MNARRRQQEPAAPPSVNVEPVEAVEVQEPGVLERIERANIDISIATAHQYPRSLQKFKERALAMVTLDEETAASCIYRRPVGRDARGMVEYAEGKSIRMAEIVGSCFGNLRVGAQLIEQSPRQVRARGFAHDLETNFAATSEVIEATVGRDGKPYSERMRAVVAKACLAKALRDATFKVVPGALCKALEEAARETAIGTKATLGQRRRQVADWVNKLGIEPERVWAAIGVKGIDDVGLKEMETLTGLKTAIRDGDTTVDEAFPLSAPPMPKPKEGPPEAQEAAPAGGDELVDLEVACADAGQLAGYDEKQIRDKISRAKEKGADGLKKLLAAWNELGKARR